MNKEEELKIIKDMQAVVAQMKADDIEENPDCEFECLTASAAAKKNLLPAPLFMTESESAMIAFCMPRQVFALGKIKDIQDLIANMEDKKLEAQCNFIKQDEIEHNN
ncbi:MAG: hypothetical protein V8R83_10975 [Candidatus Gastranaerophilaceae bacterium]